LTPVPRWVEVGDPLRDGADAVMPPDAVIISGGVAEAQASVVPGDGVLAKGASAGPGEPLRRAGQILRAVDLAIMGSLGVARVQVRVPRVRLLPASLLADADHSRIPLVGRAIALDGGTVVDDEQDGKNSHGLEDALLAADVDAVIVVGGVGMGRHECAVTTLARVGAVAIHGVGLRPGDSAAIGSVGARPVLLLPGQLDAALAAYLVVGGRLLAKLTGRTADRAIAAVLTRKIVSTVGVAEVVLVRTCQNGVEPIAAGHFPLQAMTQADGYVVVPPASEGYAAGTVMEMRPLP
jgi:molybdopterin molybdotransferase